MGVKVREKVKGSGKWWVFINHQGRRRSKKIGDKRAANAVKRELEARLAKGDLGMLRERCPSVAKYGREWLDSPLREWTDSTRSNHSGAFGLHIKPALGNKRLDEIKRKDVKALIAEVRNKGLSSARAQGVLAVLSGLFESAIEDEIVSANPCQNAGKHCGNETVVEISPLTAAEVQTMLENASKLPIDVYTFLLVAVRTGLRAGELLALEWSDIDFDNRFIEVSKSYSRNTKKIGATKNKKTRKVDLTPAAAEALRKLQREKKVLGMRAVFSGPKGKRQDDRRVAEKLKEIAPRPLRLHDLRHTYATLRIAKGDNILDVSRQLGHHKVAFTIDQYGHWIPGEHKPQVDELDNLHLAAPHTHPQSTNPHH
jgi:integrase